MSGGTLMVWLRVCKASIGVPEGGRHAAFLQPFADEPQEFVLFAR
jgi:hypothetical protein